MATTNLNIRMDKEVKDQAEQIFNELGLNMTTAAAIQEGRRIAADKSVPGYTSIDALKAALDV
ncbi:MAG: type II toxin-antitoxin system RelB/DinJ family antitoxin [Coprococcus sp.]